MKNTFWKRAMAVIGIVALLASNAADIMPALAEDSGTTTETAAVAADTEEGGSQLNLTDTSSDSGTAGKDQNVSSDDSTDTDSKAAAAAAADSTANDASGSSSVTESTSDSSSAAGSTSDSSAAGTSAASTADSSAAVSSADTSASSAAAAPSKTVYTYEDSSISVTATLTDAAAIPDDAQLVVTPVTKDSTAYNYDAYIQALNSNASAIGGASSYDENNTLLYDVAFIGNKLDANGQAIAGETQEYEPASGTVSVSVTLKQKQATEELGADSADGVKVVHLPLTDAVADSVDKTADATNISAGDVQPEVVGNVAALDTNGADQVSFNTSSLSVFAVADAANSNDKITMSFYESDGVTLETSPSLSGYYYLYIAGISGQQNQNEHVLIPIDASKATEGTITYDAAVLKQNNVTLSGSYNINIIRAKTSLSTNTSYDSNNMDMLDTGTLIGTKYIVTMPAALTDLSAPYAIKAVKQATENNGLIYRSILGDAVYYGIVAKSYTQQADTQTNFAVKTYKGNGQTCGGDLSNNPGDIWVGSITDSMHVRDLLIANNIFCAKEDISKVYVASNNTMTTVTGLDSNDINTKVQSLIDGVTVPSGTLLSLPATSSNNSYLLDTTDLDDNAVIYIDLDSTNGTGNTFYSILSTVTDGVKINKKPNQTIVFHSANTSVSIRKFSVCDNGTNTNYISSETQKTAGTDNNNVAAFASSIIWDFPNATTLSVGGTAVAGVFVAKKLTDLSDLSAGCAGWLVADSLDLHGEWHNIYQDMPASITNSLIVYKKLIGRALIADEFTFQLTNPDGSTVSVKNVADGSVTFNNLSYTSAGTYTYKIKEVIPSSPEAGITYDEGTITATVHVIGMGNGFGILSVSYAKEDKNGNTVTENPNRFTNSTGTHTPSTVTVSGTKKWVDDSNRDGVRPDSITLKLYGQTGTEAAEEVTGYTPSWTKNGNTWNYTYSGLPEKADGQTIVYTVEETNVDSHYTASYDDSTHLNLTNTHTPSTVTVSGTKRWVDDSNRDGVRPDSITLKLYGQTGTEAAEEVTGYTPSWTKNGNTWNYTYSGLPEKADGQTIVYTVEEINVDSHYTASYDDSTHLNLTNTHTPSTVTVSGTKRWVDDSNRDGVRPDSITLKLYGQTGTEAAEEVTGYTPSWTKNGNTWNYTYSGLPEKADGQTIVYTVEEINVDSHYTASYDDSTHLNLTNTHTPSTVTVSGTKKWVDDSNRDGVRPDSITLKLYGQTGTEAAEEVTGYTPSWTKNGNTWNYTYSGLPEKADGQTIVYTVEETNVDSHYTASYDDSTHLNLTNTHTPSTVTVSGTKKWVDDSNRDGVRPDSITLKLYGQTGTEAAEEVTGYTPSWTKNGNTWNYTYSGLPEKADGQTIVYTVEETNVDSHYTASYDDSTHLNLTNTHTSETTQLTVRKLWSDENNYDGIRPSTVTIHLLADETDTGKKVTLSNDNSWTGVFDNLPLYSNGTAINYSVKEDDVAGYTVGMTVSKVTDPKSGYSVDITNTHTVNHHSAPATGSVTVSKVNATGAAVEGAKLVIVNTDTKLEVAGTEWTTDGKDHTVSGLTPGKYAIRELSAPDGYEKADDIEFIINGDGSTTYGGETTTKAIVMIDKTSTTPTPSPTPTPKNNGSPKNGSVTVSKVNASGIEIAGAQMIVTNAAGSVVASWTTAANQSYTVSDLVQGTYTLHEVSAPDGYQLAGDITFTVANDGTVTSPALSSSGKLVMLDAETPSTSSTTNNTTESTTTVSNVTTNASSTVTASTSSVRTGDTTNAMLYIILMAISASIAGIWFAVMMNRRKNSNR